MQQGNKGSPRSRAAPSVHSLVRPLLAVGLILLCVGLVSGESENVCARRWYGPEYLHMSV